MLFSLLAPLIFSLLSMLEICIFLLFLFFPVFMKFISLQPSIQMPFHQTLEDSLSLSLQILTIILMIFCLLASIHNLSNTFLFYSLMSLLLLILLAAFSMNSILMFYVMFEVSLLPMSMMIMGWGYQPERLPASLAMMLYTMMASLPFLFIIIVADKFWLSGLIIFNFWFPVQSFYWHFLSFLIMIGFLVKFPMFLVHLWLPKAHVEAPVVGSMILAAILLKLGGYGIWRLSFLWMHSKITEALQIVLLVGGSLVSFLCLRQLDLKVLIAYSSVAHMSIAIMCILQISKSSSYASVLVMLTHGISSSAMFAGANEIYKLNHSRNMLLGTGILSESPKIALFWFFCCLANMAAPPSMNLIAEIWSISMMWGFSVINSLNFMAISFLAAAYSLWLYSAPFQGQKSNLILLFSPLSMKANFLFLIHIVFFIELILIF